MSQMRTKLAISDAPSSSLKTEKQTMETDFVMAIVRTVRPQGLALVANRDMMVLPIKLFYAANKEFRQINKSRLILKLLGHFRAVHRYF